MNRYSVIVIGDGGERRFDDIWASSEWEAKRHVFALLKGRANMNDMRVMRG